MKKKILNLCIFMLAAVLFMLSVSATDINITNYTDGIIEPVALKINGQYLNSRYTPVIFNNTTIVPLRDVMETLGFEVVWNDADNSISIVNGSEKIELQINSHNMKVNSEDVHLDIAPMLMGGSVTYIPLRAVSEALGALIGWDADNSTASIFTLNHTSILTIGDYRVKVGSTVSELVNVCSEPDYKIIGEKGLIWYVYAKYPSAFMAVATDGGIVCGYYTSSTQFSTSEGYVYGTSVTGDKSYALIDRNGYNIDLYYDTKDKILYGISYMLDGFSGYEDVGMSLKGQARLGLDILNSFRYAHGKYPLTWDEAATASCTDHAYYITLIGELTHTSADTSSAIARYLKYVPGTKWLSWGENICAEANSIFACMNSWINSGHYRNNLLSDKTRAGIGFVYSDSGKFSYAAAIFLIK